MLNQTSKHIATERFGYGNHEITVEVRISNTYVGTLDDVLSGRRGDGYWRQVKVRAREGSSTDVRHETYVREDQRKAPASYISVPFIGEVKVSSASGPMPLPEQIEQSVRPVLEELDEAYQYLEPEMDVDVEVGVERVRHEMSWTDVDDEIDRISSEIDAMAESEP
jgi:hypothetical protein